MAEKFPTPQERAMAWLLEATEIGGMSRPETQKPFGRVKRTYPAYSLEDINYPMEATEE